MQVHGEYPSGSGFRPSRDFQLPIRLTYQDFGGPGGYTWGVGLQAYARSERVVLITLTDGFYMPALITDTGLGRVNFK